MGSTSGLSLARGAGDNVAVADRFFVLLPYGADYFSVSGSPVRTWNYGYNQQPWRRPSRPRWRAPR
jgi:hypothetical protein